MRYRFRSTWWLDAPSAEVRAALADVAGYPVWWQGITAGPQVSEADGWITVRGALPYGITVRLTQIPAPDGVLAARIRGDLEGWSAWHLRPEEQGTRVLFRQRVVVRQRMLRAASPLFRPALAANHALVLRRGEAGLRRHLAAQ